MNTQITKWAQAIQKAEGWCIPGGYLNGILYPTGTESWINGNPGNMGYSTLTASWGATKGPAKKDGGFFSKFQTYEQGFQALVNFLTLGCEDELLEFHQARTLCAFMKVYAGNPSQGYIQEIATEMGVPLATDISTFLEPEKAD